MKRIIALPFFFLLALSFLAGCVVRVQSEPVVVAGPPPAAVVETPAPAVEVTAEAPPPIDVAEPDMVVVPSGNEYVYMVPNVAGVYFYNGLWYRYYGGAWFSASVWGAPWVGIGIAPGVVVGIDPFYAFYLPVGYFHIGWGDFHGHWRSWGHDHHWNNRPWFRNEMRRDVRSARINRINADRRTGRISRYDRSGKVSSHGSYNRTGRTGGNRTFNRTGGTRQLNKAGGTRTINKSGGNRQINKSGAPHSGSHGGREHERR